MKKHYTINNPELVAGFTARLEENKAEINSAIELIQSEANELLVKLKEHHASIHNEIWKEIYAAAGIPDEEAQENKWELENKFVEDTGFAIVSMLEPEPPCDCPACTGESGGLGDLLKGLMG